MAVVQGPAVDIEDIDIVNRENKIVPPEHFLPLAEQLDLAGAILALEEGRRDDRDDKGGNVERLANPLFPQFSRRDSFYVLKNVDLLRTADF